MGRNRADVSIWVTMKDKTAQARKGLRGGINKIKSAVFSLRTGLIALGGAVVLRAVGKLTDAFGKQQDAIIQLNSTLRNTGRFTDEVSKAIQRNASELQKVTTAGDEVIIQATSALGALAEQLTGPDLIRAQEAIIGLAHQFFGGDLQGAAQLLGKTLRSDTNALIRYGIEVDVTATQQEKLNQIMQQSGVFFENAKAAADGLTGSKQQLSNVIGDVKESLGQAIAETFGFEQGLGAATEKVSGFNDWLQRNMNRIVGWGRVLLQTGKAILKTITGVVTGAFEVGVSLGHWMRAQFHAIIGSVFWLANQAIGGINLLIRGVNKIPGVDIGQIGELDAAGQFRKAGSAMDDLADSGLNVLNRLQDIGDAWLGIVDAAAMAANEQDRAMTAGPGSGGRRTAPTAPDRPGFEDPATLGITDDDLPPLQEGLTLWQSIGKELALMDDNASSLKDTIAGGLVQSMEAFGVAALSSSAALGEGMVGALKGALRKLGGMYQVKAIGAIGDAIFNPLTAGKSLAAAAKYQLAASTAYALAGTGGGGGFGGGGFGGGGTAGFQAERTSSFSDGQGGEATIVIEGGLLDMTDPRQAKAFEDALNELEGRRITIRGGGRK